MASLPQSGAIVKSILVAVSGTNSDIPVLDAAYAMAAPLKAHLDFVHIPLASIDVVDFNHHVEFARGSGLKLALKDTLPKSKDAESRARAHVMDFCAARGILRMSQPVAVSQATVGWIECTPSAGGDGLLRAARTHDLTVVGRSAAKRSWSQNLLEALTAHSGRPVLIIPPDTSNFQLDKVVVWWKDHGAAARAVTAALPLLGAARHVTLLSIEEDGSHTTESIDDMARQLGWHGIKATAEVRGRDHRPTINILWSASLAEKADLIVMGGFSRSRVQEMIFGGCTQSVLEGVRPIFLMH